MITIREKAKVDYPFWVRSDKGIDPRVFHKSFGIDFIRLPEGDHSLWCFSTSGDRQIFLEFHKGAAIDPY